MKKIFTFLLIGAINLTASADSVSKGIKSAAGIIGLVGKGISLFAPKTETAAAQTSAEQVETVESLPVSTGFAPAYHDGMYVPAVPAPWEQVVAAPATAAAGTTAPAATAAAGTTAPAATAAVDSIESVAPAQVTWQK